MRLSQLLINRSEDEGKREQSRGSSRGILSMSAGAIITIPPLRGGGAELLYLKQHNPAHKALTPVYGQKKNGNLKNLVVSGPRHHHKTLCLCCSRLPVVKKSAVVYTEINNIHLTACCAKPLTLRTRLPKASPAWCTLAATRGLLSRACERASCKFTHKKEQEIRQRQTTRKACVVACIMPTMTEGRTLETKRRK